MTDPAEIVEWLRGVHDTIERAATAAGGDRWRIDDSGVYHEDPAKGPGPFAVGPYGYLDDDVREHIGLHDPARALDRVNAERRLLATAEDLMWDDDRGWPDRMSEAAIRLLASGYASWPGYQERWKP